MKRFELERICTESLEYLATIRCEPNLSSDIERNASPLLSKTIYSLILLSIINVTAPVKTGSFD